MTLNGQSYLNPQSDLHTPHRRRYTGIEERGLLFHNHMQPNFRSEPPGIRSAQTPPESVASVFLSHMRERRQSQSK
jgi:hypothetical protein